MEISKKDAMNYIGGAKISLGVVSFIVGGIAFILGIINGYHTKVCTSN